MVDRYNNKKQVQRYTPKKNLYLWLMDYIRDNSKLPTDIYSKQKINYYLSTLKSMNIVYKVGYGVWNIDEEKYKEYRFKGKKIHGVTTDKPDKKYLKNPLNKVRGHGFVFTIPINQEEWYKREQFLLNNNIMYKNIPQGHQIKVKENKVWLCNKSIVVYFNKDLSFYGETATDTLEMAKNNIKSVIVAIENMFKISLDSGSGYKFKVSRNHYARLNSLIAEETNKKDGLKLYYSGKLWLLTDKSFKIDELETVHSETAKDDQDKIIGGFLNDMKDLTHKTGEVPKFSSVLNILNETSKLIQSQTKIITEQSSRINNLEQNLNSANKIKQDRPNYFG